MTSQVSAIKEKIVSHLQRGLSLIFVGNILTTLLNVVMVKQLTNRFELTDYGIYSLIMAFITFPQIIVFGPISASVFPFYKKYQENNQYNEFQDHIFQIFYLISLVFLLLPLIVAGVVAASGQSIGKYQDILYLTTFFSVGSGALSTLDSFSLANSKIREFTFFPLLNLLLKIVLLFALGSTETSPQRLILFFSIQQIILFAVEVLYLKHKKVLTHYPLPFTKQLFKISSPEKLEIFKYASNFSIWGLFFWLQNFCDKWILNNQSSSADVAIYAVYYQYGFFPFTMISSIISQYITPLYFSKLGDREGLKRFMQQFLPGLIIAVIGAQIIIPLAAKLLAPHVIPLLTNASYLKQIQVFPLIVVAGIFFCFAQILAVPLLNADLVTKVRTPKIASSVLAVVLFAILVPRYGIWGIASTLILINGLYFLAILKVNYGYFSSLKSQCSLKEETT